MPRVTFTSALQRHVPCPPRVVGAGTLADVLGQVFAVQPRLRSYVLDEQGALRRHVAVFIDGSSVEDRGALSDEVGPDSEVYVMQALSGG